MGFPDDFHTEVTVIHDYTRENYDRPINVDENGKFFTWHENKIYLRDWIKTSMKELREKVDKKKCITSDDLCQAIMSDGVSNVRFMVPLNIRCVGGFLLDGTNFKNVECRIVEEWGMEVNHNFKIKVVPVVPDNTVASSRDYYTTDMAKLIQSGSIKILL